MPEDNNFHHAKYSRSDPANRVTYLTLEPGAAPFSPAWKESLGVAGKTLHDSGVRLVLLLYGSYLGADLFGAGRLDAVGGLKRGYSRGIPGLESLLAMLRPGDYQKCREDETLTPPFANDEATKTRIDKCVKDHGNFSSEYQQGLQEALSSSTLTPITCVRHLWSSRHHHLGRMEGALYLFHELMRLQRELHLTQDHRILILAHGHAGQLTALLSNLLGPEESFVRGDLIEALGQFYGQSDSPPPALTHLQELDQFLATNQNQSFPALDVVTLGTAIRYGWNTSGIGKLLHLVNHRPLRSDGKRWLAKMDLPNIVMEMPAVMGGDYVQQLAVASTDAVPATPLQEEFNQTLQENLEPYDGFERWLECARRVTRCPNDGRCFLIDYQDAGEGSPAEHLYGHACYTQLSTLLFQTRQIAKAFYS
ncbi:hypothetical protein [Candidatus Nitronereus thalassa]|uniref:Uncharacterized protein n=1 Tax=Candidatus Nitronereus thalassa TaxID=3020898 RepID=A0ABU3K8G3_9BACT|nr:hypothetical protein [Candidatus Nitronereus thalassa]MDT7042730.1 hypothetical protein [Candidatus Nitronereus thalassa]